MAVDKHSSTWREVEKFIVRQRKDAVQALVADRLSEQQRGKLDLLDALQKLALDEGERLTFDEAFEFLNH